jgi:hypothetical protein
MPALFTFSLVLGDRWPAVGVLLWVLSVAVTIVPFVADGVATRRANRSLPVVEVDREPAVLGTPLRIHVEIVGPAQLDGLYVDVECRVSGARAGPLVSAVPVEPLEGVRFLALDDTYSNRWTASLPLDRPATTAGAVWSVVVRWAAGGRDRSARYALRAVAEA